MDTALFYALRLAKEGFGTPQAILEMPVDIALAALEYSTFLEEYAETSIEINKDDRS